MFNLLERFYEPQTGKITINRTDIKKYTLKSLRENIAEVSQSVFLFNGSIEDNIKYGRPDATHEEVVAAAIAANADGFINEFPNGYETSVGEGGGLLSGGQKQRLLIARALAGDPQILVLDDASSALDYRTDAKLRLCLRENYRHTTTVLVAQRVSSLRHADLILVLRDGAVIGAGTHDELMESCSEYSIIAQTQMGERGEVV